MLKRFVYFFFVLNMVGGLLWAGKFSLSLSENFMFSRDQRFRDIYGQSVLLHEVRLGYRFYGDYYVWGSYGLSKKSGKTQPYLNLETTITQHFFGAGLGFTEDLFKNFGYKLEAGFSYSMYRENVFNITSTGHGIGFRGEIGLVYKFSRKIFTELNVGYQVGYKKGDIYTLKMGGFRTGFAIGVRL